MGILVSHPEHSLVGHHPILILAQEDDICSVVVGTGRLVYLHKASLQALEKKQHIVLLFEIDRQVHGEPKLPGIIKGRGRGGGGGGEPDFSSATNLAKDCLM